MKSLTIRIEDESLVRAIADEAKSTGCTMEDIVVRALQFWKVETELDEEERQEIEESLKEWRGNGGIEAKGFLTRCEERKVNQGCEV